MGKGVVCHSNLAMSAAVGTSLTQQSTGIDGVVMPKIDFAKPHVTRMAHGWLPNEVMVARTLDWPSRGGTAWQLSIKGTQSRHDTNDGSGPREWVQTLCSVEALLLLVKDQGQKGRSWGKSAKRGKENNASAVESCCCSHSHLAMLIEYHRCWLNVRNKYAIPASAVSRMGNKQTNQPLPTNASSEPAGGTLGVPSR